MLQEYLEELNKPNIIIVAFDYTESYYRAIHANYQQTYSKSVLLKYLGDSTKNTYLNK